MRRMVIEAALVMIQLRLLEPMGAMRRHHGIGEKRNVCRGARREVRPRAAVREAWLEHKRFPHVRAESFSERLDLRTRIVHRIHIDAALEHAHVTREEFLGVGVVLGVRDRDGGKVQHSAGEDAVNDEIDA